MGGIASLLPIILGSGAISAASGAMRGSKAHEAEQFGQAQQLSQDPETAAILSGGGEAETKELGKRGISGLSLPHLAILANTARTATNIRNFMGDENVHNILSRTIDTKNPYTGISTPTPFVNTPQGQEALRQISLHYGITPEQAMQAISSGQIGVGGTSTSGSKAATPEEQARAGLAVKRDIREEKAAPLAETEKKVQIKKGEAETDVARARLAGTLTSPIKPPQSKDYEERMKTVLEQYEKLHPRPQPTGLFHKQVDPETLKAWQTGADRYMRNTDPEAYAQTGASKSLFFAENPDLPEGSTQVTINVNGKPVQAWKSPDGKFFVQQ